MEIFYIFALSLCIILPLLQFGVDVYQYVKVVRPIIKNKDHVEFKIGNRTYKNNTLIEAKLELNANQSLRWVMTTDGHTSIYGVRFRWLNASTIVHITTSRLNPMVVRRINMIGIINSFILRRGLREQFIMKKMAGFD
jgi:hypothetical protein